MKTIITALFLICLLTSNGQSKNYSKFVNERLINKKQIVKIDGNKEDIIYLGRIRDKNGKTLFYVMTAFGQVQAAITIHGYSNVIYLDSNKVVKKQFKLGGQDDLPFKLKNNHLYFYYLNSKTSKKLYINFIGEQLPKVLCVGPNDCY